jgi:hypothetical protein
MKLVLSLLAAELTLLVLVSVFPNRPELVLGAVFHSEAYKDGKQLQQRTVGSCPFFLD